MQQEYGKVGRVFCAMCAVFTLYMHSKCLPSQICDEKTKMEPTTAPASE